MGFKLDQEAFQNILEELGIDHIELDEGPMRGVIIQRRAGEPFWYSLDSLPNSHIFRFIKPAS